MHSSSLHSLQVCSFSVMRQLLECYLTINPSRVEVWNRSSHPSLLSNKCIGQYEKAIRGLGYNSLLTFIVHQRATFGFIFLFFLQYIQCILHTLYLVLSSSVDLFPLNFFLSIHEKYTRECPLLRRCVV